MKFYLNIVIILGFEKLQNVLQSLSSIFKNKNLKIHIIMEFLLTKVITFKDEKFYLFSYTILKTSIKMSINGTSKN